MKTIHRIIVSAVLLSKDEKVLLGKVREGGVYPNCWHIPGGGVEANETQIQALIREIHEEVGIHIDPSQCQLVSDSDTGEAEKIDKHTGETIHVVMQFHTYLVKLVQNAEDVPISLHDDLQSFVWVHKKDLGTYQHTPPSEKLFRKLGWMS